MTGVATDNVFQETVAEIGVDLRWSANQPVVLARVVHSALIAGGDLSLVEVFTAGEQRGRSNQGHVRSAVGQRLRYVEHTVQTRDQVRVLQLVQRDPLAGLEVVTLIERPTGRRALRIRHEVTNVGAVPIVLTGITSASIGFGSAQASLSDLRMCWGESQWLAEGRWHEDRLRTLLPDLGLAVHGQDGRGRWSRTSHGTWSTGEFLPIGVIAGDADAFAWQIETSGAWHWELTQTRSGGALSILGPTGEHGFAHRLEPGATFASVPVGLAFSDAGRDGAFAEMTRYRRWLRELRRVDGDLPVIYNDFMNTLMAEPSTERLLPLVDAAASVGAEYFCIDAGWFADPAIGSWWSTVGEWREAPARFSGGLRGVIDAIHARGMHSGLWLEPEVVGVHSPIASRLPDEAFFQRFGQRVREDGRYHLDFRHPAARAHLDETVDHLVAHYGISYFKLDYNINPGPGTDLAATSAADGLLGHTRAFREWMRAAQRRHPEVLFENCSSGAMRMDYSLLSVAHLQSTSDQQDFRRYPPIAAAAPASILPEQCGNWAYPAAEMSTEETAFALVAGIVGRLYLSGFLGDLSTSQLALVREAVATHKALRHRIARAVPFWPLGLPGWSDEVLALGLDLGDEQLLAVWSRAEAPRTVVIPGIGGAVEIVFPRAMPDDSWSIIDTDRTVSVSMPAGCTARVFRIAANPTISGLLADLSADQKE